MLFLIDLIRYKLKFHAFYKLYLPSEAKRIKALSEKSILSMFYKILIPFQSFALKNPNRVSFSAKIFPIRLYQVTFHVHFMNKMFFS